MFSAAAASPAWRYWCLCASIILFCGWIPPVSGRTMATVFRDGTIIDGATLTATTGSRVMLLSRLGTAFVSNGSEAQKGGILVRNGAVLNVDIGAMYHRLTNPDRNISVMVESTRFESESALFIVGQTPSSSQPPVSNVEVFVRVVNCSFTNSLLALVNLTSVYVSRWVVLIEGNTFTRTVPLTIPLPIRTGAVMYDQGGGANSDVYYLLVALVSVALRGQRSVVMVRSNVFVIANTSDTFRCPVSPSQVRRLIAVAHAGNGTSLEEGAGLAFELNGMNLSSPQLPNSVPGSSCGLATQTSGIAHFRPLLVANGSQYLISSNRFDAVGAGDSRYAQTSSQFLVLQSSLQVISGALLYLKQNSGAVLLRFTQSSSQSPMVAFVAWTLLGLNVSDSAEYRIERNSFAAEVQTADGGNVAFWSVDGGGVWIQRVSRISVIDNQFNGYLVHNTTDPYSSGEIRVSFCVFKGPLFLDALTELRLNSNVAETWTTALRRSFISGLKTAFFVVIGTVTVNRNSRLVVDANIVSSTATGLPSATNCEQKAVYLNGPLTLQQLSRCQVTNNSINITASSVRNTDTAVVHLSGSSSDAVNQSTLFIVGNRVWIRTTSENTASAYIVYVNSRLALNDRSLLQFESNTLGVETIRTALLQADILSYRGIFFPSGVQLVDRSLIIVRRSNVYMNLTSSSTADSDQLWLYAFYVEYATSEIRSFSGIVLDSNVHNGCATAGRGASMKILPVLVGLKSGSLLSDSSFISITNDTQQLSSSGGALLTMAAYSIVSGLAVIQANSWLLIQGSSIVHNASSTTGNISMSGLALDGGGMTFSQNSSLWVVGCDVSLKADSRNGSTVDGIKLALGVLTLRDSSVFTTTQNVWSIRIVNADSGQASIMTLSTAGNVSVLNNSTLSMQDSRGELGVIAGTAKGLVFTVAGTPSVSLISGNSQWLLRNNSVFTSVNSLLSTGAASAFGIWCTGNLSIIFASRIVIALNKLDYVVAPGVAETHAGLFGGESVGLTLQTSSQLQIEGNNVTTTLGTQSLGSAVSIIEASSVDSRWTILSSSQILISANRINMTGNGAKHFINLPSPSSLVMESLTGSNSTAPPFNAFLGISENGFLSPMPGAFTNNWFTTLPSSSVSLKCNRLNANVTTLNLPNAFIDPSINGTCAVCNVKLDCNFINSSLQSFYPPCGCICTGDQTSLGPLDGRCWPAVGFTSTVSFPKPLQANGTSLGELLPPFNGTRAAQIFFSEYAFPNLHWLGATFTRTVASKSATLPFSKSNSATITVSSTDTTCVSFSVGDNTSSVSLTGTKSVSPGHQICNATPDWTVFRGNQARFLTEAQIRQGAWTVGNEPFTFPLSWNLRPTTNRSLYGVSVQRLTNDVGELSSKGFGGDQAGMLGSLLWVVVNLTQGTQAMPNWTVYVGLREAVPLYDIDREETLVLTATRDAFSAPGCVSTGGLVIGHIRIASLANPELAAIAQATSIVSGAALVAGVGASGVAVDAQTLAVLGLMSCSRPFERAMLKNVRTLSPAALSETINGAWLGNLVLIITWTVLHLAVCLVLRVVKDLASFEEAMSMVRFPSLTLSALAMLHQGTVFTSVTLMLDPQSAADWVQGIVGYLYGFGLPLGILVHVMRNVRAEYMKYAWPAVTNRVLKAVLLPHGRWEPREVRLRNGTVMGGLRTRFRGWVTLGFGVSTAIGIGAAVRPTTNHGCLVQYGALAAGEFLLALVIFAVRPFKSGLHSILSGTSYALLGLAMTGSAMNYADPRGSGNDLLAAAAQAQLVLTVARLVHTVAFTILEDRIWAPKVDSVLRHKWTGWACVRASKRMLSLSQGVSADQPDVFAEGSEFGDSNDTEASERLVLADPELPTPGASIPPRHPQAKASGPAKAPFERSCGSPIPSPYQPGEGPSTRKKFLYDATSRQMLAEIEAMLNSMGDTRQSTLMPDLDEELPEVPIATDLDQLPLPVAPFSPDSSPRLEVESMRRNVALPPPPVLPPASSSQGTTHSTPTATATDYDIL